MTFSAYNQLVLREIGSQQAQDEECHLQIQGIAIEEIEIESRCCSRNEKNWAENPRGLLHNFFR